MEKLFYERTKYGQKGDCIGYSLLVGISGALPGRKRQYLAARDVHKRLWGVNDELVDSGIELGFGITSIYQINAHGGLSTSQRRGRHHGRYEATMDIDLEKLLGIEGGSFSIVGWGGWPDAEGIDELSVGSYFGVNADAIGNQGTVVKELYYQGPVFNDRLTLRMGKIAFAHLFGSSAYADDECTQLLNNALIDDPTIPFPDCSLGVVLNWDITDSWYLMGGVADAKADVRETGFRTTFHDEDYFFYGLETGITAQLNSANGPMQGTYRNRSLE